MYKPTSKDPKCSFSISLPVSIIKAIEVNLRGQSRSEFIKQTVIFWFKNRDKVSM